MLLVNPRSTAIVASIPLLLMLACSTATSQEGAVDANAPFETGLFRWQVSPPLLGVKTAQLPPSPEHPWIAVKDPSIVRYEGNWHLFCTLRKQRSGDGRIRIGYLHFRDWSTLNQSSWSVLTLTDGYHGAPQIFYFRPQKKWYLIYQAADDSRDLKYGPCFSTTINLTNRRVGRFPSRCTSFQMDNGRGSTIGSSATTSKLTCSSRHSMA